MCKHILNCRHVGIDVNCYSLLVTFLTTCHFRSCLEGRYENTRDCNGPSLIREVHGDSRLRDVCVLWH